ncbi:MAG: peptidylprolyl isomerase [Paracoccaceae bacterium]
MRNQRKFNHFATILIFIVIFFFSNWNLAIGQSFKPRVIIGDLVLTSYDISQKKKMLSLFHGRNFSENDVVELFISEIIKSQHAQKMGIQISDFFIRDQLKIILDKTINGKTFSKILEENSVEREHLYETIKSGFLWNEVIKMEFSNSLLVSAKELSEIKPQVTKLVKPRILSSLIYIPFNIRGENNTIKLINRLKKEIQSGADFSILARRFSKDPSSKNGGSLGWKELSQFSEKIRLELKKTALGAITDPIRLGEGISIFKIINRQSKIKPKKIKMLFQYAILPESENYVNSCENIDYKKIEGPILLKDIELASRTILERMKINETKALDENYNLILCNKEPDLTESEKTSLISTIQAEKAKRFGEGLYSNLRQNAVITFHEH